MVWLLVCGILYFNMAVLKPVTATDVNIKKFSGTTSCNLQASLDANCTELQPDRVRSIVECSARCGTDCVGVSFHKDNRRCYVHSECPMDLIVATCGPKDQMFNSFTKQVPCQHKGVLLNETSGKCNCTGGWVGDQCEKLPSSCQELILSGYNVGQSVVTYVKVASLGKPFKTICTLNSDFISSRLMLTTGFLRPNRTWKEYVEGFYVNKNNFWVGLEKMRALHMGNKTILRIDTQFGLNSKYNLFAYIYNHFSIGDSSSGYRISFGISGPVGSGPEWDKYNTSYTSCLAGATNISFSTSDHDNDGVDRKNCAALTGIGWWFSKCDLTCNPLGSRNDWLSMIGIDLTAATYAESMMYFTTA